MQKYAVLYAKYAEVYILHILHLYALPTLLMVVWWAESKPSESLALAWRSDSKSTEQTVIRTLASHSTLRPAKAAGGWPAVIVAVILLWNRFLLYPHSSDQAGMLQCAFIILNWGTTQHWQERSLVLRPGKSDWPAVGDSEPGLSSLSSGHCQAAQTKRVSCILFCPFAPVESFLVVKVSIAKLRRWWDINWVVTSTLFPRGRIQTPPWISIDTVTRVTVTRAQADQPSSSS